MYSSLWLQDLIKICDQTSLKLCSTPDIHLNTPLHIAAKLGHLNIVEELLKDNLVKPGHVKLDAKNESKKTPAHLAAENGHVKLVSFSQWLYDYIVPPSYTNQR